MKKERNIDIKNDRVRNNKIHWRVWNDWINYFEIIYLRRFVRHFAHPAKRQDIAVALGVVILLEVQMHVCDAIGLPVGIRFINLSNRHRNRLPLRIVPRPNSTTSLFPRATSSSTSRTLVPWLADLDPVIDNRITQLTRQRACTRPACVPRPESLMANPRDSESGGRCSPPRTRKERRARRARVSLSRDSIAGSGGTIAVARIISLTAPWRRGTTAVETTPLWISRDSQLIAVRQPPIICFLSRPPFCRPRRYSTFRGCRSPCRALRAGGRACASLSLSFARVPSLFLSFTRTLNAREYPRRERASDWKLDRARGPPPPPPPPRSRFFRSSRRFRTTSVLIRAGRSARPSRALLRCSTFNSPRAFPRPARPEPPRFLLPRMFADDRLGIV